MQIVWQLLLIVHVQSFADLHQDHRFDVSCPEYVRRSAVIPPEEFSTEAIQKIGAEFLAAHRRIPFAVLRMAISEEYLRYYSGKGTTDSNYDNWEYRLGRAKQEGWEPLQDIAEVDVINGEAIVRVRKSNEVTRTILTNHDPLFIAAHSSFEILQLNGMASNENGHPCLAHLTFFLQTANTPSDEELMEAGLSLQKLAPAPDLFLFVRKDPWFISMSDFPWVYAFGDVTERSKPRKEEFARSSEKCRYFPGIFTLQQ